MDEYTPPLPRLREQGRGRILSALYGLGFGERGLPHASANLV